MRFMYRAKIDDAFVNRTWSEQVLQFFSIVLDRNAGVHTEMQDVHVSSRVPRDTLDLLSFGSLYKRSL